MIFIFVMGLMLSLTGMWLRKRKAPLAEVLVLSALGTVTLLTFLVLAVLGYRVEW